MDRKKYSLNERTKEYFSKSKDKVIDSYHHWLSAVNEYSDEEGLIKIAMDNVQIIHSIGISDKLLAASDNNDLPDRLTRMINKSIIHAGKNAAREMRNAVSGEEYQQILLDEKKEIRDQLEALNEKNKQLIQAMTSMKRTVVSPSGQVTVTLFGNRIIHSIMISQELCSVEKKKILEKELMETVNKAMQENLEEIQGIMKQNEEDVLKNIVQEAN